MKTNKYKEFKETQQNKLNDFTKENMFFAFSQSQFEDWLKKLNTTKDKITQTHYGWFILTEKLNDYKKLNSFLDEELKEFLQDSKNLLDAFNEEQKQILERAKEYYLKESKYFDDWLLIF